MNILYKLGMEKLSGRRVAAFAHGEQQVAAAFIFETVLEQFTRDP